MQFKLIIPIPLILSQFGIKTLTMMNMIIGFLIHSYILLLHKPNTFKKEQQQKRKQCDIW